MNQEIEFIARAFYSADDDAQVWDHEPEVIKDEFRRFAREAIALLAQADAEEPQEAIAFSYAA